MRWRFGGDFEPVLTTCAFDWMECPFALADYIWSEVVTDVAECLANETILWRILALLLICTTVVHLIYWQVRWTKEIQKNNRNLKEIDFKVQDLELKVNIFTYKAQYGTWPLPSLSRASAKTDLQESETGLSKFSKENSWIENLLTRKKNTREMNNNYSTRHETYIDTEISQSELDFSDNNLSTDVTLLSSSLAQSWKGQIISSSPSDAGTKSDTRKTLYEVKRRLENLHLSLKTCTLRDWTVMGHTNSYQGRANIQGRGYDYLSSRKRKNNHDSSINLRKSFKKHSMSDLIAMYAAYNSVISNTRKTRDFVTCSSDDEHSSVANTTECSRNENSVSKKNNEYNIDELSKELSTYKNDMDKSMLQNNIANGTKLMESHKGDGDSECFSDKSISSKNNDKISVISEKFRLDENSKESDTDDKSTSALLEEAVRIKRELLSRIELRKEYEPALQEPNGHDKTDDCIYWEGIENPFESKMLDMISEESSDSSSIDGINKTDNALEKCTNSQEMDHKSPKNETTTTDDNNVNLSNDENQSLSIANVESARENSNLVDRIESHLRIKVDSQNNENTNVEELNLASELNSSKLTESSSDTSVNRLIDRLIESERRSKSARSSSDTKSKKNLSVDSINNLIDIHKCIEPVPSENEETDNCLRSDTVKKYNNFENNNIDNLGCAQSLPSQNIEGNKTPNKTMSEIADDKENEIHEKKLNITNLGTKHLETVCANTDLEVLQLEGNKMYTTSIDEKTCVELLMFENDEFSRRQVPINELINVKPVIEELDAKNESALYCNKSSTENQPAQENISTITLAKLETIEKRASLSTYNNPITIQPNNYTFSPRIDIQHYPVSIVPNSLHNTLSLRNVEHGVNKIQKNINPSTIQKQFTKNITDFKGNRQIRAISNLNLSLVEKYSASPIFRRSKSYATPHDISLNKNNAEGEASPRNISLNNKNNTEGEASFESLTSSSKSSSISHTPRELKDNDGDIKLNEETKKSSFESLAVSTTSSPKSHVENMTLVNKSISEIKRNNSYKSLSSRSSKSHSMTSPREAIENQKCKVDIKGKNSFESLTLSSKSSSKSSIPILKNRSESTRKNMGESRSSPIQDLLPITLGSYNTENEKLLEGLQNSNDQKQESSVYVNTTHENDKISSKNLNSEQFFEYIKNTEIELKSAISEEKINASIVDNSCLMILSNSKVTSLIPSSSENIDFTDVSSVDSNSYRLQNDQPQSQPFRVDSKETEVLVKPLMLDISTSITDLRNNFHSTENHEINELKILEIPEELTKEEYDTFLQMMNENTDLRQLTNIE